MNLPPELAQIQKEIESHAISYGLDFFETHFELLDFDQINQVASYGGIPTRYPHWRFGMEYESLSKGYRYGLQKIYELVINNDPTYAYLMKSNAIVDQKLVMSHVYGHADFFKNNLWFAHTNRKMIDEMANHGTRIRRYIEDFGQDVVETWMDHCLSIEHLIDPHAPPYSRYDPRGRPLSDSHQPTQPPRGQSGNQRQYMNRFLRQRSRSSQNLSTEQSLATGQDNLPETPQRDILLFLIENAPLQRWQRDILEIIRSEAYYFAPQAQTKILNEGWASYWHSKIMTEKVLTDSELIDYADHHSATMAMSPGSLNPYKLGIELLRDIEREWDANSKDIERHSISSNGTDPVITGKQKIFEIRTIYNDIGFIDTYLTESFCRRHALFTTSIDPKTGEHVVDSREFGDIKRLLLFQLTNHGRPLIRVHHSNHANRGELYLVHQHEGVDLHIESAHSTLRNLQAIWKRPVHLETRVDNEGCILSFDGKECAERSLSSTS
ncbi:MAG: SpoVR family protein [Planctomycetota bacterium]|jgi:stage V sporulation protein R|nr:SpoVR family protein [Planctomycetota bacterium]